MNPMLAPTYGFGRDDVAEEIIYIPTTLSDDFFLLRHDLSTTTYQTSCPSTIGQQEEPFMILILIDSAADLHKEIINPDVLQMPVPVVGDIVRLNFTSSFTVMHRELDFATSRIRCYGKVTND